MGTTESRRRLTYPFTAIVGQDGMKEALLISAIDPLIGGVLIMGDRGTGKSTAVRGLAALLPPIKVAGGCPYNCDPASACSRAPGCPGESARKSQTVPPPVIDLPLGVTEDRVVGALDIERALSHGEKVFEPGLLARANRGFLYIDEVNLLEDHIVDLLLDVAASGQNLVEREGLSVRHPAAFVLIGSGNPEEGDLRPQLQDRFGLCVDVSTPTTLEDRITVIRRRDSFESDRAAFVESWKGRESRLRTKVRKARSDLEAVDVPDQSLELAAKLCLALGTDGMRGELTLMRAARALAALRGDKQATQDHIVRVAHSALGHRLRRDPLESAGSSARIDQAIETCLEDA